jgi:hypothetical protein
MKVKLQTALAGERFSFRPRQVVECSAEAGQRLVAQGLAVEVPSSTESDGRIPESSDVPKATPYDPTPAPSRRRAPETAAKGPAPEASVTAGSPAHCTGRTARGNQCLKAPLPGKDRCAQHAEEL